MEFNGDIARKTGSPSLLAVEALKTERAAEIGKSSGLFYVPRVVNFDAEAGVLEFERLRDLVTLLDLAIKKDLRLFELLEKTGRALAMIHQQLVLPDEMKYDLPAEWMGPGGENVFIHGDFACINVCFHEPSQQLVILDWSTAPLLDRTPTFGSRFFDVLWFASSLFHGAPGARVLSWDAEKMCQAFFTGCCSTAILAVSSRAGSPCHDPNRFKNYVTQICRLHKKNIWHRVHRQRSLARTAASIVVQRYMYTRLRRFLRACDKIGFV